MPIAGRFTRPLALACFSPRRILLSAAITAFLAPAFLHAQTPRAATPTFSVAPGSYPNAQTVTITDTTPGVTIYYTTNGTYPGTFSPVYSTPITVSQSEILVAVAYASGYNPSPDASAEYLIATSSDRFIYSIAGNGTWGYSGDGGPATAARVNSPYAVLPDSLGNVYIADTGNNVVRKIDGTTGVITTIAGTGTASDTGDNGPAISATLWTPQYLALDNSGNLYIAETGDSIVRKLNLGTGVITRAAGGGTGNGPGPATGVGLVGIIGVACDSAGNLFIGESLEVVAVDTSGNLTVLAASFSTPNFPSFLGGGFAMDAHHNFYLFATGYEKIYKLDSTGAVTLFAGTGLAQGGDGGLAVNAGFGYEAGLATDNAGNLYVADAFDYSIRKIDVPTGTINTIAGVFFDPYSVGGNGDPATSSGLYFPLYISVDAAGNIYLADYAISSIRKITAPAPPPTQAAAPPAFSPAAATLPLPQSLTVSGSTPGSIVYLSFDGSTPATSDLAYHGAINLSGSATINAMAVAPGYLKSPVSTGAFTIGQPPTAVISTVAGMGYFGFTGNGGPAATALIGEPTAIAFRPDGGFYIAEEGNNVVRLVAAGTGIISVVAGTGTAGFSGDGGPATSAQLWAPTGLALDSSGNLYIADTSNFRVRKVDAVTGTITTFAGGGTVSPGDGGLATAASLQPGALAVDSLGNLLIGDLGRVHTVSLATNIITTVAGGGHAPNPPYGDGGPATSASVGPNGIALDANNNLYISDTEGRVRRVDAATHIITSVAGGGSVPVVDGVQATSVAVQPLGVALDAAQNVYFSSADGTVREILPGGTLSTIAGNTYFGYSGDGGAATIASIDSPRQIAFDTKGSLYISDAGEDVIRKVNFLSPAATPTFSLAAGSYTGVQTITISSTSANASIYYTTDGSTPNTASALYSGPVTVNRSETLQAIAVASGFSESAVASAAYAITIRTPGIVLTSSAASAFLSNPVTFTANIAGSPGTPTGTVTFFDGTTQLGTGTLSAGVATYTTSTLAAGTHSITASYSGDANFKAVTSLSITETIEDFTLGVASGSSASATISAGGSASYTLAITPPSGVTTPAAITLSVAGSPTGATATFSPASVAAGSGATNVTLTVKAPASAAVRTVGSTVRSGPAGRFPAALSILLLPLLGLRRARRALGARTLLLFVALAGAGALFGCGGGGSGSGGGTTSQPQSYTLTVAATAGSLSHTTALTLTVQ